MTTKSESQIELDKLIDEFGEIPQVDRDVIDGLCDAFMEALDEDDEELRKDIREVYHESLMIAFYVGMMEGITRGRREGCPLTEDCEKKKTIN